ncbi:hypothetical protein [Ekhidna sp.]|uniref:hypothetical protein n=1 Tax=Ekhidna sp. TaxID=2608089 RepID=UPI0032EE08BD
MFEEEDDIPDSRNLPIFQKGMEIAELVRALVDLIPEDNEILQEVGVWMMNDAHNLAVKVSGAEAGDLYDIKMECAAIIRRSARELVVQTHSLEMHGFEETQYFQLLRDAVEEYRLLFIDWIETFDPWNYIIDRWGLFNPPGVGPHDQDPDDLY